ncbi:tetratricopeptide repeat protein [Stackebrandtia albiflava]|uniref:Tetratricopeptide repeat protein n=1 Tax=Stackebrandtia albiflava TaxID=406432 RepID=A0A562UPN1_9ACTN|nr:tetratricopeptide repeat protein [Stackebrandtia albiflava]TWJ07583.1 tetratricopeptide repeat protein [Stackebrandtia albiflava]
MRERDLYGVMVLAVVGVSAFCVVGWGTRLANELAGVGAFVLAAITAAPVVAKWWGGSKPFASSRGKPGIESDEEREKRYRRGIEAGDAWAMYLLGILRKQQGNLDEAERWIRKAADAGLVNAMLNLSVMAERRGDTAQAREWMRKAADS